VTSRTTPINDDLGDQFPGALAAGATSPAPRPDGADERLVLMRTVYAEKINAAVQAGREDLAYELAERTFAEELSGSQAGRTHLDGTPERRTAGRRTPTRNPGGRPPGQAPTTLGRLGSFTRRSLDRFDRYTLDVFNPRPPYGPAAGTSDRSA
jgi:hypothetical protein